VLKLSFESVHFNFQHRSKPERTVYWKILLKKPFVNFAFPFIKINWIKTDPKKGFFGYLRICGPEQEYYDKIWKPSDIAKIK
jgi:hypothetical protein